MQRFYFIIKVIMLISLVQAICLAQGQTELKINVFNQKMERVPDFVIFIKNLKGNLVKEIKSTKAEAISVEIPFPQKYLLEIFSVGFKSFEQQIELKETNQTLDILLRIEEIKAEVNINQPTIERAIENSLSKVWNIEEIASLPANPNEIENEIKRKYGDEIIIKVNGFTGGQMPPKEQISSVKVIKSSFDAEFHSAGKTIVDIRTKAGATNFFGVVSLNFNDAGLNARSPFALSKFPEQKKLLTGYLTGPLKKNKSSFHLMFLTNNDFETKNIVARVPNKEIDRNVKSSLKTSITNAGIDYNLTDTHTLNLIYSFGQIKNRNVGIGELNLPETGATFNDKFHQLRLFEAGVFNKKFVNEMRFEFVQDKTSLIPNSLYPSISVLGSFVAGGSSLNNATSLQKADFADNLFFDAGQHFLKFGVNFQFERRKTISKDGINGSFIFTSPADFENNQPTFFSRQQSSQTNLIKQYQLSLYGQDEIRFSKHIQVGIGLRYEVQNNLTDINNFSPRLSLVYSPTKEGKIVFRGGAGIFYHWLETEALAKISANTFGSSLELITLGQRFSLPPSVKTISSNLINPAIFVSQTGFSYRVNNKINLEFYYKFQRGNHLFRSRDINAPLNGSRQNPTYGRISQFESSGNLTEQSVEIQSEGSLIWGTTFSMRYRFAKSFNDFEGNFDLPVDNYDLSQEKGFSNLDRRHRLTGNLNFLLFKKLQITPIFYINSPLPYTITTGKDDNGDTVFNDRPNKIKRNTERGAWLKQVDFRLNWRMPISFGKRKENGKNPASADEIIKSLKKSVGVSITIQNAFNFTNAQNYVGNQISPFYRKPTSTSTPRKILLGLNYIF